MHRVVLAVVLSGLALLAGCTSECTLIGCSSGISVSGAAGDARVCLDDVCETFGGIGRVPGPFARFDDVHEGFAKHILTVGDVRYEGPIAFTKMLPNGADCGPRCYQAAFVLDSGSLRPV